MLPNTSPAEFDPSPQLMVVVKSALVAVGVPSTKLATYPLNATACVARKLLPVPPMALMRPSAPLTLSSTHSFLSPPRVTELPPALSALRATELITPSGVIRATLLGYHCANQMAPSEPAAIPFW